MRFDLEIITGNEAQGKLPRIGALTHGAGAKTLSPGIFFDGKGIVPQPALAEAGESITAPEPELGIHITRDGLLVGFRFVVLDRRWLVWNRMEGAGGRTPNHLDPHLIPNGLNRAVLDYSEDNVDYFAGWHLLMHWDAAYMYHHWLFECVPRILFALQMRELDDFRFAFPTDRPRFVDETLDLLAVPLERRSYFNPKRLTRFEVLGLTPVPVYERDHCSISALQRLRSGLLDTIPLSRTPGAKKIFFTRRDAPNSERLLITEPQVVTALEAEGFVALESGTLSIADQIRTVHTADIIVYIHGSAGANLIFAANGTKILHVFPDVTHFFVSHGIGAAVAGAQQAYLFGPSFQRRKKFHNSPWLISPDRVLSAIRKLENGA